VSKVAARRNQLSRLNGWIEGTVEKFVAFFVRMPVQPAFIASKLESAMDSGTYLLKADQRLAPNVYDIYLNIKDHQRLSPGQFNLIQGWQDSLIHYARRKRYILKTDPILRLHGDSKVQLGLVHIEAKVEDTSGGNMSTQALSPEQLALLRAQLAPNQQLPGIDGSSLPSQVRKTPIGSQVNSPFTPSMPPVLPIQPPPLAGPMATPALPWARLTIRLPQAGSQIYQIEKPVINIGRQLSNDIIVEDKRVSRNHAQIKFQSDGQFAIYDLGSTNGITINNTPNMRQHVLRSGDHFTIGSYDFYFERR
jgi:predicted component of type VI protein secretion system